VKTEDRTTKEKMIGSLHSQGRSSKGSINIEDIHSSKEKSSQHDKLQDCAGL